MKNTCGLKHKALAVYES